MTENTKVITNNTIRLPIILSNNIVVFPHSIITAVIDNTSPLSLLENLLINKKINESESSIKSIVAVFPLADDSFIQDPNRSIIIKGLLWFYRGCIAEIIEITKTKSISNDSIDLVRYNIVLKGLRKCELIPKSIELSQSNDISTALVKDVIYEQVIANEELTNNIKNIYKVIKFLYSTGLLPKSLTVSKLIMDQLVIINDNKIEVLVDSLASLISSFHSEKLQILTSNNIKELLISSLNLLKSFVSKVFRMDGEMLLNNIINDSFNIKVENNNSNSNNSNRNNRLPNFFNRQELDSLPVKPIKRGNNNDDDDEIESLRMLISKTNLPEYVLKVIEKELNRLQKMSSTFPEFTVAKTYIETLLDIPWLESTSTSDLTISKVRETLELEHYGLFDIKNRIYEYVALMILRNRLENKSKALPTILCFSGPPGVGKTSLGRSIANALGRKFERISLGGVHDESEIRGHRRTYVGAIPGVLVQALRRCNCNNPVILLDEIDKIGTGRQSGDPSAALLEVLDPDQNATFVDHYLAVPLDLSQVIFIATANRLDVLSSPLRDRMEIIELSGYTIDEKISICTKYLLPKQIKSCSLSSNQIDISNEVVEFIIHKYTREAGVRQLEKKIGSICRYIAMKTVENDNNVISSININKLIEILGPPIFEYETSSIIRIPGRSTGLAWTPTGGEILFIESTYIYPSIGKLTITGNMGEVMQESCSIALSWIKYNFTYIHQTYSSCNEIDDESFSLEKLLKSDIHIHVPAGAIPKDGPSAGCAITVSMISAFLGVPIDNRLAMTGEITLLGDVLPVGGIKEKVLAAKQAGIRTVILPNRNKKDFDKINNEKLSNEMKVHYVNNIFDVLKLTFKSNKINNLKRLTSTNNNYTNKEIIGTVITKPYDTISITNSNQVLKSSL